MNMKKAFAVGTIAAFALVMMASCGTAGGAGGSADSLWDAIAQSANEIGGNLPQGATVSVVAFDSESDIFSDSIMDELVSALVRLGVEVVDRRSQELAAREMNLSLDGSVSDETALRLGHLVGARFIITRRIRPEGGAMRFAADAIEVETSRHVGAPRFDVRNDRAFRRSVADLNASAAAARRGPDDLAPPATLWTGGFCFCWNAATWISRWRVSTTP